VTIEDEQTVSLSNVIRQSESENQLKLSAQRGAFSSRWTDCEVKIADPSPLGRTSDGRQDFRGVKPTGDFIGLNVRDADFSRADFDQRLFEDCVFENCCFDHAVLTRTIVRGGSFANCTFERGDLRNSFVGFRGTSFTNCSFSGARVKRISLFNAIFTGIEFDAAEWSGIDFGCSGFWSCAFRGAFNGNMFYGKYLFPEDNQMYGVPRATGLHGVSFKNAELYWIGFKNGCVLEDILLPASGTAFLCSAADLARFGASYKVDPKYGSILSKYLDIVLSGLADQKILMVSEHNLAYFSDPQIASDLYALIRGSVQKYGAEVAS